MAAASAAIPLKIAFQQKYSTERQQNQSFCRRNIGSFSYANHASVKINRAFKSVAQTINGSLISESFSLILQSQKKVPNYNPEQLLFRWIVLRAVIWYLFFGDLGQSENLSEIKSPLKRESLEFILHEASLCNLTEMVASHTAVTFCK